MTAIDSQTQHSLDSKELETLAAQIKDWGKSLGFSDIGISDTDLKEHEVHLNNWLDNGHHGEMHYMQRHGTKRSRPEELIEGTVSVISVRLDYAPQDISEAETALERRDIAYISRYALGRDYHKVIRKKLESLAKKIQEKIGRLGYRVFTDSAPVLEKALAEKAGLGWIGKHSNLLNSKNGSWFFLGEIYVDIPLPADQEATNHCGSCRSCIDFCPTNAIVAPYTVDARRCISYLTIELKGSIPVEFRDKIGNRVYGCDDCQIVCPWNKFAKPSKEKDFTPREHLTDQNLLELFDWSESTFLRNTEGTAIRRIGFQSWIRNMAVGIGNMAPDESVIERLETRLNDPEIKEMAREHIEWAIARHRNGLA